MREISCHIVFQQPIWLSLKQVQTRDTTSKIVYFGYQDLCRSLPFKEKDKSIITLNGMVLIPNKNPLNLVWIQGGQELWTGRVSRVISRTIDHLKGLKKKGRVAVGNGKWSWQKKSCDCLSSVVLIKELNLSKLTLRRGVGCIHKINKN